MSEQDIPHLELKTVMHQQVEMLLRDRDLTPRSLAKKVNAGPADLPKISEDSIYRILNETQEACDTHILIALANGLECNPDHIVSPSPETTHQDLDNQIIDALVKISGMERFFRRRALLLIEREIIKIHARKKVVIPPPINKKTLDSLKEKTSQVI